LNTRRAISLLVSAAAAAAALWIYESQPRRAQAAPAVVPIHAPAVVAIPDGKTIDFSDGSPAVKDSAADKAAMDAAVKEMDAASKDVTFPANPPPKK
jgi:hypothetical protein